MNVYVKSRFKKTILLLLAAFFLLFIFRLVYGYQINSYPVTPPTFDLNEEAFVTNSNLRKNYASKKYMQNTGQVYISIDQKYEKIADISTLSTRFDYEERIIREHIMGYDGLIQFENKSGNKGQRKLNLVIGVPPENFDSIYQSLSKVGSSISKQITKTDKTNEYRELNAQKTSLEKIRSSLIGLKSKSGRIDEYMQLENRILEIEGQLQGLGISLGNFDAENEFCTVKITISEGEIYKISILQRVKTALEWTILTYLQFMAALTFMSLFAYLLLLSIEKIRTKI